MRMFSLLIVPVLIAQSLLTSCVSNEEFEQRLDKRNAKYLEMEERRDMRLDARDERYEAWSDRVLD